MGYYDVPTLEKKEYEVKGTVTISSEEYRDILDHACELKLYAKQEHEDWRKERDRADEAKKEVNRLNAKLSELNEWLEDNPSAKMNFKEWKLEKLAKENESEE